MSLRVLDLFCGAGGSAVGYDRGFREAGMDVDLVGVDIRPQPNYPYEFVQADALDFPLDEFDLIHASPPCKAHTKTGWAYYLGYHDDHEDLLTPTRERLSRFSTPYVLENVPGAPMVPDVVLCGSQFGLNVRRHRWFETRPRLFTLMQPCMHSERVVSPHGNPNRFKGSARAWAAAMEIDWMTGPELAQAIPPAYTQYIAAQLVPSLKGVAA